MRHGYSDNIDLYSLQKKQIQVIDTLISLEKSLKWLGNG